MVSCIRVFVNIRNEYKGGMCYTKFNQYPFQCKNMSGLPTRSVGQVVACKVQCLSFTTQSLLCLAIIHVFVICSAIH